MRLCSPLCPPVRSPGTLEDGAGTMCHLSVPPPSPPHRSSSLLQSQHPGAGVQGELQLWGKAVPVPIPSWAAGPRHCSLSTTTMSCIPRAELLTLCFHCGNTTQSFYIGKGNS